MSTSPAVAVQVTACEGPPALLYTSPLICPAVLMPMAALESNVGRVPMSCRVPLVQLNPCSMRSGSAETPATWPVALTPSAWLEVKAGSVPRSVTVYDGAAACRATPPSATAMTARTARFDVSLMGSASIDESVDEGTAFRVWPPAPWPLPGTSSRQQRALRSMIHRRAEGRFAVAYLSRVSATAPAARP